jgi:membrane fusion protein, multidrug efflux system
MDDVNRSLEAPDTLRPGHGGDVVVRAPQSRRWLWLGWIVLFLLIVAGIVWWVQTRPAPQTTAGRFALSGPMPVVTAPATKGDVSIIDSELGTVTPLANVTVRTQIAGQLFRFNFQEGQEVNKGDLLAEIDSRPYVNALNQLQGQLAHDQALLNDAKIDLARYATLVKQDSIAHQQYDTQQYLVHQYEGTVISDQAQVDNAKLNIEYCHITAPVTGRVGLRQVDPGNYVQTSDTNGLVILTQLKPISVIFTVPEDQLPAIMKRVAAGATLPVTAFDRTGNNRLAEGKLETVDNQIDTTTGTVKLRAIFPNDDEVLFPNQFVNVDLEVDVLRDATVVPTAAIQRGAPGTFVYVVNADSTVKIQKVKLGPIEGDHVAIKSGLNPGDTVVVDGADKLKDGAKVAVHTAAATDGAGAVTPGAGSGTPSTEGATPTPAGAAPTSAPSATGSPAAPATPSDPNTPQRERRRRGNNPP